MHQEKQTLKEKFKNVIWDSGLSDDDKDMWYKVINRMNVITLKPLLESLELFPQDLPFLTKNFKDKVHAFRSGDEAAARRIIDEEEEFLESR